MKELADTKLYFWPYDLFGYLLPGFVVIVPLIEFNTDVRAIFTARFSEKSIPDVFAIVGIAYTLGHIIAALSSLFLERLVLRYTHGYPGSQVFRTEKPEAHGRALSLLLWLIPGQCHAFPRQFTLRYFTLYNKLFHQNIDSSKQARIPDDLFWNCSLYASVHHPTGFRIAQHFVELYGFARNTCMSLLVLMFYPLLPGWDVSFETKRSVPGWAWALWTFLAAYFMYVNYTKLLRRQNDHIFRSFFVSASEDPKVGDAGELLVPRSDS